MLYRIALYTPCPGERGFEATRMQIVGTLRAAELVAASMLPPAYETVHSARYAHLPFVTVTPVKHFRSAAMVRAELRETQHRPVTTYETPVVYVPSCGDLGWCP